MAVAHVACACQLGGHDFLLYLSDSVRSGVGCIERRISLNHAMSSSFLGRAIIYLSLDSNREET